MGRWAEPGSFRLERIKAEQEREAKRKLKGIKAELATKLASEILFSPRKRPLEAYKETIPESKEGKD